MPAAIATRDEVIDKLLLTFRRFGYESASLALISEATGLGKASLYHHFPGGKREMLIAVLASLEEKFHRDVLVPLAAEGDPARRIGAMFNYLRGYYRDGHEACLLGMLALEDERKFYQARLTQFFATWIDALAIPLRALGWSRREAKRLAGRAISRIQGTLIIARGLSDYASFKKEMAALRSELIAAPTAKS